MPRTLLLAAVWCLVVSVIVVVASAESAPAAAATTHLHQRHHHQNHKHDHHHHHPAGSVSRHGSRELNDEYRSIHHPRGHGGHRPESQPDAQVTHGPPSAQHNPGDQYYKQYYNPSNQQGGGQPGGPGDYSQYYPGSQGGAGGGSQSSDAIRSGAEGSSSNIRASGEMARGFMPGQQQSTDEHVSERLHSHHRRDSDSDDEPRKHHRADAAAMVAAEVASVDALELSERARHSHRNGGKPHHGHQVNATAATPTQAELNAKWQQIGQEYATAYVPIRVGSEARDPSVIHPAATSAAVGPVLLDDDDLPAMAVSEQSQPPMDAEPEEPPEDPMPTDEEKNATAGDEDAVGAAARRHHSNERDSSSERRMSPVAEMTMEFAQRRRHHADGHVEQRQQAQQLPEEQQKWREIGMAYRDQYAPAAPADRSQHGQPVTRLALEDIDEATATALAARGSESNVLDGSTSDPADVERTRAKAEERDERMAQRLSQIKVDEREEAEAQERKSAARATDLSDRSSLAASVAADYTGAKSEPSGYTITFGKVLLYIVVGAMLLTAAWWFIDARRKQAYQPITTSAL